MLNNRMRISKNKIIYIFYFALLAMMDINMFYLVPLTGSLSWIWGVYRKLLLVIISVILFLWCNSWSYGTRFMKKYTVGLVMSLCIISVSSYFRYDNNSFAGILLEISYFMLILLAFPVVKFLKKYNKDDFFKILNFVSFVLYVVFILQVIIYNSTGNFFLYIDYQFRNDSIRFSLKSIACIMIIYNFCQLWVNKYARNKWFNLLQVVLGLYCVFFIQQTRAFYLAIGGAICAVLLFYPTDISKRIRNVFVLIVIVATVIGSGYLSDFLETFGQSSIEYNSTIIRQGGFLYFWNEFLTNPLLGHGIIVGTSQELQTIKTGPLGCYYYADTGFVGMLPQLGIFIVNIYLWPIFHFLKGISKRMRERKASAFSIGLITYILLTSVTVICLNPAYYIIWPISMALLEFESIDN
mgnify:CR=1 FL=1